MSNDSAGYPQGRTSLASELDHAVGDVEQEGSAQTAFLVGLTGRSAGKLFRLRPGESLIGRSSGALVRLDEKAASHQHAKLLLNSRGCYLVDLESTNGTFVNDVRVNSPTGLHAGDVVRCGTSSFGFLTDAEDDEQHTRAMARLTGTPATGVTGPPRGLVVRRPSPLAQDVGTARHSRSVEDPRAVVVASSDTVAEGASLLDTLDGILDKLALVASFFKQNWKLILSSTLLFGSLGAVSVEFHLPAAVATCEVLLRGSDPRRRDRDERLVDYFEMAEKNWTSPELVLQTMKDTHMRALGDGAVAGTAQSLLLARLGIGDYELSFRHEDPRFAEEFLAAHVKNFLETQIGKAIAVVKSEADLLRDQFQENKDQLEAAEARLADFKQRHPEIQVILGGAAGPSPVDQAQRDTLAAQLQLYTQQLAQAKKVLDQAAYRSAIVQDKAAPYEQQLLEQQQQLVVLRSKGFAETHPEIVQLKARITELEQVIRRTREQSPSDDDVRMSAEYQRQQQDVARLAILVNSTQTELGLVEERLRRGRVILEKTPEAERQYAELLRAVDTYKGEYDVLHKNLKSKELQLDLERANVAARYEVMRQPHAVPVNKLRTAGKRAGLGVAGGLVFGLAAAALLWLKVYSRQRTPAAGSAIVRQG